MHEHVTNIDTGTAKILDLDADANGMFLAICDNGQVIENDNRIFLNSQIQSPIIRRLDENTFLLADISTVENKANAFIYNFKGQLLTSFFLGDCIQDIVIQHGKIVVAYFDEGIFGIDGPNNQGLCVFSFNGIREFSFNENVEGLHISDCYCISKKNEKNVLFYAYDCFDVVELNLETYNWKRLKTPKDIQGFSALTSTDYKMIFHISYDDKQSFFEWDTQKMEVKTIGKYSSPLKGLDNGKFLAVSERGFTIISI